MCDSCRSLLPILLCVSNVFHFFFFKQKTAYEMRISDWSSDVCSSDLVGVTRLKESIASERPIPCGKSKRGYRHRHRQLALPSRGCTLGQGRMSSSHSP